MANLIKNSLFQKRKKNPKMYFQISNIIKSPLSFIKGAKNIKDVKKDDLNQQEILNFIRFITNLHYNCEGRPCEHVKDFFKKLSLCIE